MANRITDYKWPYSQRAPRLGFGFLHTNFHQGKPVRNTHVLTIRPWFVLCCLMCWAVDTRLQSSTQWAFLPSYAWARTRTQYHKQKFVRCTVLIQNCHQIWTWAYLRKQSMMHMHQLLAKGVPENVFTNRVHAWYSIKNASHRFVADILHICQCCIPGIPPNIALITMARQYSLCIPLWNRQQLADSLHFCHQSFRRFHNVGVTTLTCPRWVSTLSTGITERPILCIDSVEGWWRQVFSARSKNDKRTLHNFPTCLDSHFAYFW